MKKVLVGITSAIILVMLVGSVLVPIITNEEGHSWSYDDYVPSSEYGDSVSVSGGFELVTVGGVEYIHAKDVGEGYINDNLYSISKARLDVLYMTGQSNGAYRNAIPTDAPVPELGTAYYFGLEDRYAGINPNPMLDIDQCGWWPMVNDSGANRVGNKAPAICTEYYQKTGHKVYFVDGAIDSQTIHTFLPGQTSWDYGVELFTKAISLIDTTYYIPFIGNWIWIQGEGDSSIPINAYYNAFVQLNTAMSSGEFGGYKFNHCFVSQVAYGNSIPALELVEDRYNNVTIVSDSAQSFTIENGLMGPDGLHYTQAGNNIIGKEIGMAIGLFVSPEPMNTQTVDKILGVIPIIAVIGIIIGLGGIILFRRT